MNKTEKIIIDRRDGQTLKEACGEQEISPKAQIISEAFIHFGDLMRSSGVGHFEIETDLWSIKFQAIKESVNEPTKEN